MQKQGRRTVGKLKWIVMSVVISGLLLLMSALGVSYLIHSEAIEWNGAGYGTAAAILLASLIASILMRGYFQDGKWKAVLAGACTIVVELLIMEMLIFGEKPSGFVPVLLLSLSGGIVSMLLQRKRNKSFNYRK